jgi:uncharacterized protein YcsI (UPF0317 family)
MHDKPRYIERTGHDIKNEFFSGFGFTYDLFDICVRHLQQLDSFIYKHNIPLRRRHMFESDFSVSLRMI